MFFPRLRRQARWMFVLLALVFGGGFIIFGVGSNLPSGLGDVLVDQGGSGEGAVSADEARERISENPRNAEAYRDLANALQQDGDTDGAIAALEQYLNLRPRDPEVLQALAGLHLSKASRLQRRLVTAQARAQELAPPAPVGGLTANGQPVLEPDPITEAAISPIQARVSTLSAQLQQATSSALTAYKDLARVEPREPSHQLLLAQTAEAAGEVQTAIAAYRRFIQLSPEDPNVGPIRRQIRALERSLTEPAAG